MVVPSLYTCNTYHTYNRDDVSKFETVIRSIRTNIKEV